MDLTGDNVIPFQRRQVAYEFTAETYLWFILKCLTIMFGDNDTAKAQYIAQHCPKLSMGMIERFHREAGASCQELYKKIRGA